ncbi:hypothetical protein SDC9_198497 [bioreactor metagenome]|uniref:Uncharacterized protein n=1 Tax=bioreactor metagenome TaxID=1076179 RepID=A0A645IHT4_9ZZZZ
MQDDIIETMNNIIKILITNLNDKSFEKDA